MTDINTLHDHLAGLAAAEKTDSQALAALSKDFLAAGASAGALSEILVPWGGRFVLTGSGEMLEVARRDELLRQYRTGLKDLVGWRDEVDDEGWHERITADIHKFIATHRKSTSTSDRLRD